MSINTPTYRNRALGSRPPRGGVSRVPRYVLPVNGIGYENAPRRGINSNVNRVPKVTPRRVKPKFGPGSASYARKVAKHQKRVLRSLRALSRGAPQLALAAAMFELVRLGGGGGEVSMPPDFVDLGGGMFSVPGPSVDSTHSFFPYEVYPFRQFVGQRTIIFEKHPFPQANWPEPFKELWGNAKFRGRREWPANHSFLSPGASTAGAVYPDHLFRNDIRPHRLKRGRLRLRPNRGLQIDVSGNNVTLSPPSRTRPPRGTRERKVRSAFTAVLVTLLDVGSELVDALEIIFENAGLDVDRIGFRNSFEEFFFNNQWRNLNWTNAMRDLLLNEIEDQIYGRIHGAIDTPTGFGSADWAPSIEF